MPALRRREFITLLGGAAVAWPLAVRAQQPERMRRIGVLMTGDENDPEQKRRHSAFMQTLSDLNWTDGRNTRIDLRWGGVDINRTQELAQELVGLHADMILTFGATATVAVQRGDADDPDRLCGRGRSRPHRHRRAARPPGWKHHRLRQPGSLAGRQVA